MRRALAGLAALALCAFAPPAAAPPTPVEGVTVVAPRDPKVVASFPADGAGLPSGTAVVKLTFDQAMVPQAWAYAPSPEGAFPDCLKRPRLLGDGRSFALLCSLPPGRSWAMQVNAAPGFVSEAGRAAKPFVLRFTTTREHTASLHDALGQAGLSDADDPIMDWNGDQGVSTSPPPPRPADTPKP